MLPYTEIEAPGLKQIYASRQLRLAEELNFIWTGDLSVMPFGDTFFETSNDPTKAVVYTDDSGADNWKALVDAWNTEVAPLSQHWLGGTQQTANTNFETTVQGNQRVTTALSTVTQEAFNKIATGTLTTTSKQEVSFDRVVSVEVALWMRKREFVIHAKGLKENARVYAFFDGVNVTANCYQIQLLGTSTLQTLNKFAPNAVTGITELSDENVTWKAIADGANTLQPFIVKSGEVYLLFEVPTQKFYTGQREFKVTDSPTNSEGTTLTSARNIITSQGVIQKTASFSINSRPFTNLAFNKQQSIGRKTVSSVRVETGRVTIPPPPQWDPLSQSFFVDPNTFERGMYITSIDLFFRTKSKSADAYVTIDIRELDNGFPSPELISDGDNAVVKNANINISENASTATKFLFKNPIYLSPGVDYCFTVKPSNNDPDFALWVAELGAVDITEPNKQSRIESAYNSGVLF
jgi:hypothetical protein